MQQQTIQQLQQQIKQLKQQHQQQLKKLEFDHLLCMQIYKSKGKNHKAISALLDLEKLQNSPEMEKDIALALQTLQQQEPYLFAQDTTPCLYANGTAIQPPQKRDFYGLRTAFGLPV